MPKLIEAKHISKSYGKQIIFENLNFEINVGEVLVILGKNGTGKTTLVRILLNMLYPDSGEILLRGKNIRSLGNKLYREMSAVLETVDNTYSYLTGQQNIDYFMSLYGISPKKNGVISETIDIFGLNAHIHKKVGDYSRGMKQKLAVICSLINDSKIIFFDEPTLGLDFQANKELLKIIKNLAKIQEKAIVLTSHQSDVLSALSEKVLFLNDGRQMFFGEYSEFISKNSVEKYELAIRADCEKIVELFEEFDNYQSTEGLSIFTFSSQILAQSALKIAIEKGLSIFRFGSVVTGIDDILIKLYGVEK